MNAFLEHAERIRPPRPERPKAQRAPVKTAEELRLQKEEEAEAELGRRARAAWRLEVAAASAECDQIQRLDRRLKSGLHEGDEGEVIAIAESLAGASNAVRWVAFRMLGRSIRLLRERLGLPPFDDPLMGEPDNVYLQIKSILKIR